MIRLGVISDSHGGAVRLEMFARLAKNENFDAIVHLGDGQNDVKWQKKNLQTQIYFVSGNCDWFGDASRELRLAFESVRILAVHGDKYGVKLDLAQLSYYAEETQAQIVLFGHTHQAFAGYVGGVMMVNPGALNAGRYAIIEIDKGKSIPYLKEL